MKIERNGTWYELTEKELIDAYYEQEHKFDVREIESLITEYKNENNDEMWELIKDRLIGHKEIIDKVAYRYRKYLGDEVPDGVEMKCLEDAYVYVCKCNNENPYPDFQKHLDRIKDEFNEAIGDLEKLSGCYEVEVEYDGELHYTEGDICEETTWSDFYDWLLDDLDEMGLFKKYWLLRITDVTYRGKDEQWPYDEE